jgi:hypothetical protein
MLIPYKVLIRVLIDKGLFQMKINLMRCQLPVA